MAAQAPGISNAAPQPYPPNWEEVAELRVFRTTAERWQRLIAWRGEMRRKGWRLLQVTAEAGEMVAVFGRTKDSLLARQGAAP